MTVWQLLDKTVDRVRQPRGPDRSAGWIPLILVTALVAGCAIGPAGVPTATEPALVLATQSPETPTVRPQIPTLTVTNAPPTAQTATSTPSATATASAEPATVTPCATPTPSALPASPTPSATPTASAPPASPTPNATPTPSAPPPQPSAQDVIPFFGIEMFRIDKAGGLRKAGESGAAWVRYGAFDWDRIEPVRTDPPTYHWEVVDDASLRNAANRGLQVIAVIRYAPDWAQRFPGHACGPIQHKAFAAFGEFLRALVARYGAAPYGVRYWELGNEPDIDYRLVEGRSIYGCWGQAETETYGGAAYAGMLQVAYPAIKSADPGAQVLLGGLLLDCDPTSPDACQSHPHGVRSLRFLEGILQNGGGAFFDIVSFHAYAYYGGEPGRMGNRTWPGSVTSIPEKVRFLRGVLTAYGYGDKRLMNTESALLCKEAWKDCLDTQSMYIPRAYAEGKALGLLGQIHFAMISEHWWHSGLLLKDLTPKPVYHAYRTAARFLSTAVYRGKAGGYPAGVEGYTFELQGEGRFVDVIWTHDGSRQTVPLPSGAAVTDRFGNPVDASRGIELDYRPLYVTRP